MNNLNILHITDFHVDDITSPNENLRRAKYKEYIDELVEAIDASVGEKIDLLVCTGDFVNKNKTQNWPHVIAVMNHFVSKLKITNSDVAFCMGNHDFDRSLDTQNKFEEARAEYGKLEALFHPQKLIANGSFFKIYHFEARDIYIISFDSTLGPKKGNVPSDIGDIAIDEAITAIDDYIPIDKPLIVLSHYPMILFNRSQIYLDYENWVDEHLWKKGNYIVERAYKKRKKSMTFWFFGDAHLPEFWSFNQFHHFFMTGMFGGNYTKPIYEDKNTKEIIPYNKTNQAKLIQWRISEDKIVLHTYNYRSKQYTYNPHVGVWEHTGGDIRVVNNPFEESDILTEPAPESSLLPNIAAADTVTERISSSVEEEIIAQIRERKLYTFNRYATSSTEVSLGWVSITKLFEKNELLSRCIQRSVGWLKDIKNVNIEQSNSIFIGIDFWGAIFASQCSIIQNVDNYCIATKSRSEHNILFEKPEFLCQKLGERKEGLKNVVIFTDVISTGNTVLSIQNKIKDCLNLSEGVNWIAVSIISDVKQTRKVELNNFTALGSLCINLRIPILSVSELPDTDILPIKYDLK